MSRLDSFIRRMVAQRDLLDHIAEEHLLPPGNVLEVGLGNGRTYSHLKERFAGRRVVAFDRAMAAHSSSAPDPDDFVAGEIAITGQAFLGEDAALVHVDIGTGYPDKDAQTLTWLPQMVSGLLGPGGVVASGLPLEDGALSPLPLPPSVDPGRYWLYRKG